MSVHVDGYCREHGDEFYMYAEDHPGDVAYLVLRNPDPQPAHIRYPVISSGNTTTYTFTPVSWEELLQNDFDRDRL